MDEVDVQSPTLNRQTSGIPRPSKLPLPRATGSAIPRPAASNTTLRHQQSHGSFRPAQSQINLAPGSRQATNFSKSVNQAYQSQPAASVLDEDELFKEPVRPVSRDSAPTRTGTSVSSSIETGSLPKRRPRPSLSDRTIETLSQIPPSPAASRTKQGHQSASSPMKPPSRPASAMSSGRPTSSSGGRPASPVKQFGVPPVPRVPASYGTHTQPLQSRPSASSLRRPTTSVPLKSRGVVRPGVQPSRSTVKPAINAKTTTLGEIKPGAEAPPLKSSAALREAIAQAKAARGGRSSDKPTKSTLGSSDASFMDDFEPIGQTTPMSLEGNRGLLKSRIGSARLDGSLNIAALGLKQIPDEVMKMYDFDPNAGADWAETVDLVKLVAADNEFIELREDAFPDISVEELAESEEDVNFQFGGLEFLDLHGNLLNSLPCGLRRLQRLHTLNLANNNLDISVLDIITSLPELKDLNLSSNKLEGPLPENISQLGLLQSLGLRDNRVSQLPDSFSNLSKLRKLDVSGNGLQTLPMAIMARLQLTDLIAARNKLAGVFFERSHLSFAQLVNLDLSNNQLDKICEDDSLDLPSLQRLNVNANRLKILPDLTSCDRIINLSVSENLLTEFPNFLKSLSSIRTIDISRNNLTKIDAHIALLEHLNSLRLEGNPLRERKYLTMSTQDVKRDLLKKFESDEADGEDPSNVGFSDTGPIGRPAPKGPVIKNGILDLTSHDLSDFAPDSLPHDIEIKDLRLTRNGFTTFPLPLLAHCASTLKHLDISHNPLSPSAYLTSPLHLPALTTLTLSSCNLTTLKPLLTPLTAPSL